MICLSFNISFFRHNQAVWRGDIGGKIVPRRRYDPSKETVEAIEFIACKFCFASVKKDHLPKHLDGCKFAGESPKLEKRNIVQKSQVKMKVDAGQIGEELGNVLSGLKNDKVTHCIMNDNLILNYGQFLVDKQLDTEINRYKYYIKQKLRQTADFLIALREETGHFKATLKSFFRPDYFDTMHTAPKR